MANYDKVDVTVAGCTRSGLNKRIAAWYLLHSVCSRVDPRQVVELLPQRWKLWEIDGLINGREFASHASANLNGRKSFDPSRWFLRDEELVHSSHRTYAISNQWGGRLSNLGEILGNEYPELGIQVRFEGDSA